jgi:hypothetical protein
MSQFGMQMQGARASRGAAPDIYAVLAFVALVAIIGACVVMYGAAQKVGKDGSPIGLQESGQISLSEGG